MAKAAHVDFMEDVTHFAAFGFMVQKNMLELEDARKKIAELEAKIEELKSEKKCDCECECECADEKDPPTLKDLKELARFIVDTNDEIMGIDIEVTLRKEDETDADSDDSE